MAVSYTICDTSDLALVNFGEVLQDSPDTVRKSLDGTLAILKWAGDMPPSVAALPSRGAVYDLAGISAVIETAVWTQPPMPSPVSSPTLSPVAAPGGGGTLAPGVAPSLGGALRR